MANPLIPIVLLLLAFINVVDLASSQRQMQESCQPSGYLYGTSGNCKRGFDSECCEDGRLYPQYRCSPPVTANTSAQLNLNSFAKGGDGGGPSECDGSYHSDDEMLVALSTGWYAGGSLCHKSIRIHANGKTAVAKVVDECDSVQGCDKDHDFQPPCPNNVVNASPAVWKALGLDQDLGVYDIAWSSADEILSVDPFEGIYISLHVILPHI